MVAIDPGTKNMGIAFDSPERFFTLVKEGYGKIGLIHLVERVVKEIKDEKVIIFEDYAHSTSSFNKEEGEVMGMLFMALYNAGFDGEICFVPITTAKKAVTGNGKATKAEVMKGVMNLYKIESKITHECDALALLYTYKHLSGGEKLKWTMAFKGGN